MTEEIEYRPQISKSRTPSKYVSQAFGFLRTYNDDEEEIESNCHADAVRNHCTENGVTKSSENDNVFNKGKTKSDDSEQKRSIENTSECKNSKEFVVVVNGEKTFEENPNIKPDVKDAEKEREIETIHQINPVYEVPDDEFLELESRLSEKSVPVENDSNPTDLQNNDKEETEQVARKSVVIEGEVVELRQSSPDKRISRQATWQVNQKVVSEAFGFLKDETECGQSDSVLIKDLNELPSENITNNVDNKVNTDADIQVPVDITDDYLEDNHEDSINTHENEAETISYCETGDNVGELRKLKRRGQKKAKQAEEDDGGSSDEDKGKQFEI